MADLNWTAKIPSHVPCSARTHVSPSEMKNYALFSEQTKGYSGKPIRIKIALFTQFACTVDPKSHEGQQTIRQIENLRNSAGNAQGSLSSLNSAFKYMHPTRNLCVYYSILNDPELGKSSVFITDIKPNTDAPTGSAGLYAFNAFSNQYTKKDNPDLTDKIVYINGQAKDIPAAIKTGKLRTEASDNNLLLFYTPSNVITELGIWRKTGQTQATQKAVSELSSIMQRNAKKRVYWAAEGEGAALVDQALDEQHMPMPGFRMRFIDPIANTQMLIQKMKTKEIKVGGGAEETAPITFTGQNNTARILLEANAQSLMSELRSLRVTPLNRDAHDMMIKETETTTQGSKFNKTKDALNKSRPHVNLPSNIPRKTLSQDATALTFIAALRRL